VCTGTLASEQNLNHVAVKLGLDQTEYEPEQFPGLIYRPKEHDCVLLVFGTGKVVISGSRNITIVQKAFDSLEDELEPI
jgi:transcription initiation factor TFIID TATA-box-binding protein